MFGGHDEKGGQKIKSSCSKADLLKENKFPEDGSETFTIVEFSLV